MNILPDPKILDIPVNASLKNVEAEAAFGLILKMHGLAFNRETANTYTVFRISDTSRYLKMNTHVFKIGYGDPEEIARNLKILYPRVDFIANKAQSSIFAAGYFSDVEIPRMAGSIGKIDMPAPKVRVNFEVLKINNKDVADALLTLKRKKGNHRTGAGFVYENIKSRGKTVTKANLALIPGPFSTIQKTTTVPFNLLDEHGNKAGVAEITAGDVICVRLISATEDTANLEFLVDTTQFVNEGAPGLPPTRSGEKVRSAISIKNGEKLMIGGLLTGQLEVVNTDKFDEAEKTLEKGRTAGSGTDDYVMIIEANID